MMKFTFHSTQRKGVIIHLTPCLLRINPIGSNYSQYSFGKLEITRVKSSPRPNVKPRPLMTIRKQILR